MDREGLGFGLAFLDASSSGLQPRPPAAWHINAQAQPFGFLAWLDPRLQILPLGSSTSLSCWTPSSNPSVGFVRQPFMISLSLRSLVDCLTAVVYCSLSVSLALRRRLRAFVFSLLPPATPHFKEACEDRCVFFPTTARLSGPPGYPRTLNVPFIDALSHCLFPFIHSGWTVCRSRVTILLSLSCHHRDSSCTLASLRSFCPTLHYLITLLA